jgi:hypothetical protein
VIGARLVVPSHLTNMKKTNEERFKEAAPSFRTLLKSILLFLKRYFRQAFGLKDDPTLPKRKKKPRVGEGLNLSVKKKRRRPRR